MSVTAAFIVPHPPIIIPAVGRGKQREIQQTIDAYKKIACQIAELKPDTIIVASPHATMYADYFHISPGTIANGDLGRFGASQASVQTGYDSEFSQTLEKIAKEAGISAGTLGERDKTLDHGTIVPLLMINQYYTGYELVRTGLSLLSAREHYEFGKCIAKTAELLSKKVVFIASGDLSHKLKSDGPYGYSEAGPEFDMQITDAMKHADFLRMMSLNHDLCESAAECGLRSFVIMAGVLDGKSVATEFLSYEGPFGVGYAVCSYRVKESDENRHFDLLWENNMKLHQENVRFAEDDYVKLARLSLETYVRTKMRIKMPEDLPVEMVKQRAGVFVSIKKNGQLRGCIGTIEPVTECVAKEIIQNAVSSGVNDPRFPAVEEKELDALIYSVDVLSPAEHIESPDELDVERYGVIVSSGCKRGLLLPNLDGVDTTAQQISIALQKAGIKEDEKYALERFKVVRHK